MDVTVFQENTLETLKTAGGTWLVNHLKHCDLTAPLFPFHIYHTYFFLLSPPGTLTPFQFQDPLCCHLP